MLFSITRVCFPDGSYSVGVQWLHMGIMTYQQRNHRHPAWLVLGDGTYPPVIGGFPTQRASERESIFMSWRHPEWTCSVHYSLLMIHFTNWKSKETGIFFIEALPGFGKSLGCSVTMVTPLPPTTLPYNSDVPALKHDMSVSHQEPRLVYQSAIFMSQWTRQSLVQVMACRPLTSSRHIEDGCMRVCVNGLYKVISPFSAKHSTNKQQTGPWRRIFYSKPMKPLMSRWWWWIYVTCHRTPIVNESTNSISLLSNTCSIPHVSLEDQIFSF